jgi:hypothetical protein
VNLRNHTATSLGIEPEDLELSPFTQQGGKGKAHQLFGEYPELGPIWQRAVAKLADDPKAHQLFDKQLTIVLDELNEILSA